uniref:NLR family CARD domain containing 5 n=1 Tax=Sander lucioperca TaxID=283035 RepID=A0A8D0AIB5_SANLU
MDEEADPDNLNVNSVLAQEFSELLQVLSSQSPAILLKLCQIMPSDARRNINMDPSSCSAAAVTEHIKVMLEYFRVANHADCCNFLQSMCILCEGIPMRLESRLMSVAGYANSEAIQSALHENRLKNLKQIKYKNKSYSAQYIAAVMRLLQRRWERLSERLVREVQPENVWVRLRTANRGRDRPDQTPGSADKGGRTPELDGDYGYMDSRVTLETFLQGCAGKVTVLVGQAGSGKTLLMSCLGQQWAHGLGPIPSSYLFVLQEFRQLNVLSHPLSLSELLFRHYLPLEGSNDEKRAIVDYLLSNPEQSCWVLDGYEEFHSKLTRQEVQRELLDPEQPLPVADLISGLLNRHLLPGCTVVVTCRARDVMDFEGILDKVGQLQGWDCHEIKEYVDNFFQIKGHSANKAVGVQAADLLLSSRHLLAMSSLPALCNICCICLEHLLLKGGNPRGTQIPEETGSERRRKAREKEEKGVQIAGGGRGEEDIMMDGTNGRGQMPSTQAQIPSTLTQVYLTILGAFLSRDPNTRGGNDEPKTTPQSVVCELSQLAWKGLEDSKILFMEKDISQDVLEFSIRTGLLAQVELRREDGIIVNSYRFIHLTIQEFLAALRIMTSTDVSDMQLKKRFSLRTRWTTKSDQRTVFTDSLHLYVCGLASPHCTPDLVQLARTSGGTGGQSWVQKRQTLVLKLLKNFCHSNTLTGPKILDLCHCVQESQDNQLAKQVVGTRPTLELRNITLLRNDIDALAFVVNSVGDNGIGLDFGACSMELECLDVLPSCQFIHYLSFRSRKYGDKFAEKLSSILPKFTTLKKLEFCGASLTTTGAASLASALQNCPNITEINLSDNNLKDQGIKHIADIFTKQPRLVLVRLGQNNSSLEAVDYLIGKMSSCLNIQHLNAEYDHTLAHIHLLNQTWSKPKMQKLAKSLARCTALSTVGTIVWHCWSEWKFCLCIRLCVWCVCVCVCVCDLLRCLYFLLPQFMLAATYVVPFFVSDIILTSSTFLSISLSSNCLGNTGLKKLLDILPCLSNIQEINASNNGIGTEGVVMLAGALCSHNNLTQIHIRYSLLINNSSLMPSDTTQICGRLIQCRSHFELDLSHSSLPDEAIENLVKVLPKMASLQRLNVSHSITSTAGALMLVRCLTVSQRVKSLYDSLCLSPVSIEERWIRSEEAVSLVCRCLDLSSNIHTIRVHHTTLHLSLMKSTELTSVSLVDCAVEGYQLASMKSIISRCPLLTELDFSHNSLGVEGAEFLCSVLPSLPNLTCLSIVSKEACVTVVEKLSEALLQAAGIQCLKGFDAWLNIQFDPLFVHCVYARLNKLVTAMGPSEANGVLDLLAAMEGLIRMEEIELESWRMADRGIEQLTRLLPLWTELRKISLSKNLISDQSGDKLLEALKSCSHLEELHLSSNGLGDLTAARMALVLPSLTHITVLDISENRIGYEGSVSLSKAITCMKNLTKIYLTSIGTSELCAVAASLAHCPLIQDVGLGWNNCGDNVAVELARVMPLCQKLNRIDLESNTVSVFGAEALVRALQSCPALQLIRLWRNKVSPSEAQRLSLRDRRLNFSFT